MQRLQCCLLLCDCLGGEGAGQQLVQQAGLAGGLLQEGAAARRHVQQDVQAPAPHMWVRLQPVGICSRMSRHLNCTAWSGDGFARLVSGAVGGTGTDLPPQAQNMVTPLHVLGECCLVLC